VHLLTIVIYSYIDSNICDNIKKLIVIGVIVLFLVLAIAPSISGNNTLKTTYLDGINLEGSLSGNVTDCSMNPIAGARVRVYFHGTYEEDYTDSSGYYHVTNIPLCWCIKEAVASKVGYKTKRVSLVIHEKTIHDFVLRSRFDTIFHPVALFLILNITIFLEVFDNKVHSFSDLYRLNRQK